MNQYQVTYKTNSGLKYTRYFNVNSTDEIYAYFQDNFGAPPAVLGIKRLNNLGESRIQGRDVRDNSNRYLSTNRAKLRD